MVAYPEGLPAPVQRLRRKCPRQSIDTARAIGRLGQLFWDDFRWAAQGRLGLEATVLIEHPSSNQNVEAVVSAEYRTTKGEHDTTRRYQRVSI